MFVRLALGQVFWKYFDFLCHPFHRPLHSQYYPSSGAGTVGRMVADVQSQSHPSIQHSGLFIYGLQVTGMYFLFCDLCSFFIDLFTRLSVCSVLRCPDLWLQCSVIFVHGLENSHHTRIMSFLFRARKSRCTVITDLDTSKRSAQQAFSWCDAILEGGPAAPQ
jgi:hypothetical protein